MYKKIYKGMRFVSLIALIISVVLVFSTCYYIFNTRLEVEVKEQAKIISVYLEETGYDYSNLEMVSQSMVKSKNITIISSDGNAYYIGNNKDNHPDDNNYDRVIRSIVEKARQSSFAESEKYASTFLGKIYFCANLLDNGDVLVVSAGTLDIFTLMSELVIVLLLVCILIFIFTAIIAKRLTENIVNPIEITSLDEIDSLQSPYEELKPFIAKIAYQSGEIKRQVERVERQKLRLQAVSENMNEGLIVLGKDGNILSINKSALESFGIVNANSLKNTNVFSLMNTHPEFAKHLISTFEENKRGSFEYKIGENTYEIFFSPVSDKADVMGVVILMFDVTDKLKNEQIRAEFTANVSHELKTPLTSIHGYAQLITSNVAKPEDIFVFASKIQKESERLITLVDDIIELSNLDEGKQSDNESFDVLSVIFDVAESLKINAERRNIIIDVSGESLIFNGDADRIHELIYNIADNAVKYNVEGGNVKISSNGVDRTVIISDTGIGIPPEYKDRVFERFFRVDKSHSKTVNGTGLGLSIVKHIAINNNIKISVESEQGKGTVFTLTFPEIN